MEWFIISRDMHVLCNPSTDAEYSLPIDDSGVNYGQRITLANNVAIGTYDFKTFPDHEDSKYITEGNYIAFKDKYGKDRLYTIMSIEGDEKWDVHCEDIGLDLINEVAGAWNVSAEPVETTMNRCLHDTGWSIGVNEIADRKRATKYESRTDSHLARIGMIMNAFDAECEFVIEMNGAKVTKQVVNIYKSLGEDKVQQVFIDDIDLIALSRSGSIEDLCTCMICYGKEENGVRTTIESIEYDDGRYYSPKGHIRIYDREAHQKWSRYRAYDYTGQGEFDGYVNGAFEYETDSPQELFNRGLSELKQRNDKKVSYEAELYDLQADIGDTIRIADNRYQEKLYLSARVQEVQNHYTVNGEDTGKLANYSLMESKRTQDVEDMLKELQGKVVSIDHAEISYQIGESGTEPPNGEWSSEPVDAEAGKYLWTRTITYYTNSSRNTAYSIATSKASINIHTIRNSRASVHSRIDSVADWIHFNGKQIKFYPTESFGIDGASIGITGKGIGLYPTEELELGIPVVTGNCNMLTKSCTWYLGNGSTNRPLDQNGWLISRSYSTDYCHQTYITNTGGIYRRMMQSGKWSIWQGGYANVKKLWSGTLSKGGSVAVANLSLFDTFILGTSSGTAMLIGTRYYDQNQNRGTTVLFTAGHDDGTTSYLYKATTSMSGTTFRLTSCSVHTLDPTGCGGHAATVKSLYGVM